MWYNLALINSKASQKEHWKSKSQHLRKQVIKLWFGLSDKELLPCNTGVPDMISGMLSLKELGIEMCSFSNE